MNAYDIVLKVVHSNNFSSGVNDPIFADFVILVIVELADIVIGRVGGRNDLG